MKRTLATVLVAVAVVSAGTAAQAAEPTQSGRKLGAPSTGSAWKTTQLGNTWTGYQLGGTWT